MLIMRGDLRHDYVPCKQRSGDLTTVMIACLDVTRNEWTNPNRVDQTIPAQNAGVISTINNDSLPPSPLSSSISPFQL